MREEELSGGSISPAIGAMGGRGGRNKLKARWICETVDDTTMKVSARQCTDVLVLAGIAMGKTVCGENTQWFEVWCRKPFGYELGYLGT